MSDPAPKATQAALSPSAILGSAGPIAAALARAGIDFESRPEQIKMAQAVAAVMQERSRLIVEAGTGVGKSFAYLVPAILRCLVHHEKVIIATATISLQEQLVTKDIPLLMQTLTDWGLGELTARLVPVLAKGRGNYVSIRRLQRASERQNLIFNDAEQRRSLHIIEDWAYVTTDGSLSTLPALSRPDVWDHVRSDSDNCMGRKCLNYKDCFFQKARRELEQANLIVCNHAMFFADLALRTQGVAAARSGSGSGAGGMGGAGGAGGAILPNYHHVIFDEAHNLEDAAAGHFGLTISEPRVRRLLRTLYSPRRGGGGYLAERALLLADQDSVDRAIALVRQAEDAAANFFDQLLEFHRSARSPSGRIRKADSERFKNPLSPVLRDLTIRLRRLRDSIESEQERFEVSSLARRAADIAYACDALITQSIGVGNRECNHDPDDSDEMLEAQRELSPYVYWVEVSKRADDLEQAGSRLGPRVSISGAPVDVAPLLQQYLFDPAAIVPDCPIEEGGDDGSGEELRASGITEPKPFSRPSITLTSATLATREVAADEHIERAEAAFSHILTNLGLPDPPTTRTLQLGSPFDYARQVRLIVDLTMPNPKAGISKPPRRKRDSASCDLNESEKPDSDPFRSSSRASESDRYNRALATRVSEHVRATSGGAFVLFTSFSTLNAVASLLRPDFEREGYSLFSQGIDGSRAVVLSRFMESDRGVLFGAASFWQGVDVRGDRLRNVIITRLPFEPPDRPITQARLERLEILGKNPFFQDSLPRAIIRFKQGFGRLIRSKTDLGRVVVLDPRILSTSYGKKFLSALPHGVPIETIQHPPQDEVL